MSEETLPREPVTPPAPPRQLNDLIHIVDIGQQLTTFTDLDDLLDHIVTSVKSLCGCDDASILLLDAERRELFFRKVAGPHGEVLTRVRIPLNEKSVAGWCVLNRRSRQVEAPETDPHFDREVDRMTHFKTRNLLAAPILWGNDSLGVVEAVNKRDNGTFQEQDLIYLQILASQSAIALRHSYEVSDFKNYFMYSTELLTTALEALDPMARGHIDRVARVATGLARKMGLGGNDLEDIMYAAWFHDVGKLHTNKPLIGEGDYDHPAKGAAIVERINILRRIAPVIRHHHERWDGSGFPDGLEREATALPARILALAEHYDECLVVREADAPMSAFHTDFFTRAKGLHDPILLQALLELLPPSSRPEAS
ncbi:MAG: HD-GYP domain-containing protein [Candidatus Xenobia bacterium]